MTPLPLLPASCLDLLEGPSLLLDQLFTPLFLNRSAAALLEIKNRDALATHSSVLEPLIAVARTLSQAAVRRNLTRSFSHSQETTLCSLGDHRFDVLARAAEIEPGSTGDSVVRYLVAFEPLLPFEPFIQTISQSRRLRALSVSLLGLFYQYEKLETLPLGSPQEFATVFQQSTFPIKREERADLLGVLRSAVDVVDQLVATNVKIILDARTSALLALDPYRAIRVLVHLMLEGADYCGPTGELRVNSRLMNKESGGAFAEVAVTAERRTSVSAAASSLELYLYRRFMPVHYRTTVADDGRPAVILRIAEGTENEPQTASTIGGELSDNLRIVAEIAGSTGVQLELLRVQSNAMSLTVQIPLYDPDARPAKETVERAKTAKPA